jgi:hypothetical protein
MINADFFIPEFPRKLEGEVLFTKGGREYRLKYFGEDRWVIHRAGSSREEFEIFITGDPDKGLIDAQGSGQDVHFSGLGVTVGMLFTKLF